MIQVPSSGKQFCYDHHQYTNVRPILDPPYAPRTNSLRMPTSATPDSHPGPRRPSTYLTFEGVTPLLRGQRHHVGYNQVSHAPRVRRHRSPVPWRQSPGRPGAWAEDGTYLEDQDKFHQRHLPRRLPLSRPAAVLSDYVTTTCSARCPAPVSTLAWPRPWSGSRRLPGRAVPPMSSSSTATAPVAGQMSPSPATATPTAPGSPSRPSPVERRGPLPLASVITTPVRSSPTGWASARSR